MEVDGAGKRFHSPTEETVRIKTIIFDFDGTIVESVGIKDWAFETLFKEYPDKLDEIMKYHLSHNATVRFEKFRYITENILGQRYDQEIERKLSRGFSKLVFKKIVQCPYVSGAEDFLEYFGRKVPLYLISASPAEELDGILEARNLRQYFKKIYAVPWVKEDAIKEILDTESVLPEETVFIGDAFEDYQAAQFTKVFFIGRDSGKSFHGAELNIFRDFFAIWAFLENLDVKEGLTCQIT
ncbi:MAG: HAD family hydrolase [Thermodesulfobacteriota bacterium]